LDNRESRTSERQLRIDITLVLNLHREGKYLFRTLSSLREAMVYSSINGIVLELVIVLDRSDRVTRGVVESFDLSFIEYTQLVEVDNGSLGPSRNAGIQRARGDYIRLCDGDDLVSFNLLSNMYNLAERLGRHVILIPEWLFAFDQQYFAVCYEDLGGLAPLALIDNHPFVSQIFFHRSLFEKISFKDLRLSPGYAYEDLHFATEAIAAGYEFHIVKNTILFYRQRKDSLLSLVDSVSIRQIPPSTLFAPNVFKKVGRAGYQAIAGRELKKQFGDERAFLEGEVCRHLVYAASAIEPAITLEIFRNSSFCHALDGINLAIGKRYYEICDDVKAYTFSNVFIVPFFGKGGAERYIINIIKELLEIEKETHILVILGQHHPDNYWLDKLPNRVVAINLGQWFDEIGERGVAIITLKLIQSVGKTANLHIRDSAFGQRFLAAYGRALESNKRIFYCFSQATRSDGVSQFIDPWRFRFIVDNLETIDLVISDNLALAQFDRQRIGITPERWRILPPLYEPAIDRGEALARVRRPSNRILWASRIASEKRPSLIVAVAKKLIERQVDLLIEVRGECIAGFDPTEFEKYSCVAYLGAYDRFSDCANDYVAFMYTTSQDGVPNVLLEAAAAGIPIIAPDVGGISEFVESDVTGVLLPDLFNEESMADAYVEALVSLRNDPDLRLRLASAAYDRVEMCCSRQAYRANLKRALEISVG
jgi:glycosyltransferase involved in cell wall biosynthesis